jgi:predicted PurR-regulated permease PerM
MEGIPGATVSVGDFSFHQWLARKLGKRQGLASAILVILGLALIVAPTWLLMNSFADSVHRAVGAVQQNTVHIPPPRDWECLSAPQRWRWATRSL